MRFPASDKFDRDLDIAASCPRISTRLMCFIHQGLSDLSLDARQADVEASFQEEGAVSQAESDFGLDGRARRQDDPPLPGRI